MNIISALPEYAKPKNVGLMFFCLEPDHFFPYAQIDIVHLDDDSGTQLREKIFKGPIHQQLRDALLYIHNTVITEKVVKHPDCAEADRFFNYPYEAIEEALSNAVYHKGYDVREPIEVRIESDRIIIISHPGADRSISMEGLKEFRVYSRRYRNRRIGEFLKELHLTEGRNTGFRKIRNALKANGSPEPLFETDNERTYFCTTLYIHEGFKNAASGLFNMEHKTNCDSNCDVNDANRDTNHDANRDTNDVNRDANRANQKLNATALRVLNAIVNNPSAAAEDIAASIGVSKPTVHRYQKQLKDMGYIAREGSTRGKWIILK